jgi:hypothetical protein
MLARAVSFALISVILSAPAQSQPGLLSPAPTTGSGLEQRLVPSSTPTLPQQPEQQTAAPTPSTPPPTPGPLWTRRDLWPAATRTIQKQNARRLGTVRAPYQRPGRTALRPDAMKEGSIQKRQGTQPSQVRPNRRLGAKPTRGRQEVKSRATWATREARRIAPATTELAPRAALQLPHGLMPRHARRE